MRQLEINVGDKIFSIQDCYLRKHDTLNRVGDITFIKKHEVFTIEVVWLDIALIKRKDIMYVLSDIDTHNFENLTSIKERELKLNRINEI